MILDWVNIEYTYTFFSIKNKLINFIKILWKIFNAFDFTLIFLRKYIEDYLEIIKFIKNGVLIYDIIKI